MPETMELRRNCDAIAIPSGRRRELPKGTPVRLVQRRETAFIVAGTDHAMYRIDIADSDALGIGSPAVAAEQPSAGQFNEQLVWNTLRTVYDPELPVNIVELGLIYSCTIAPDQRGGNMVTIRMAMTSPGCGMSDVLKSEVETKLRRLSEVSEANVEVVFDPPWDPSRISEAARLQLDFDAKGAPSLVQIAGQRRS